MPAVAIYAVALVVMVVEGAILQAFSIDQWALQTPLVLVMIIGLEREFVTGALIVAALLVPIEWFVAGAYGIYSAGLVAVFVAMHLFRPNLQKQWGIARAVVAGGVALGHSLWMYLALHWMAVDGGHIDAAAIGWRSAVAAACIAVATVLAGKTFARFDEMMDPHRGQKGLQL